MNDYQEFLFKKSQIENNLGFEPVFIPDFLFDFQKKLVEWSVLKGRGAIFADCGLGKSPMQLVWAENIVRKTNKNVLLLTPIAVGQQMEQEAKKFGIEVGRSRNGEIKGKITITNYEQLHKYNPSDFEAVVCDESGILKNFDGKTKHEVNMFMRKIPYRLLATATAAPNDFIELGNSSEVLGELGYMDMLGKFFKNDQNNCATNLRGRFTEATKWRLKGHAHDMFWRWVTSWSRAIRKPSDLGFDDSNYMLPILETRETELKIIGRRAEGRLFASEAKGLKEQREETRETLNQRCDVSAEIANDYDDYSVIWCNLNDEGDMLEKLIKDSVQVSGKDTDESKEEKLIAFSKGQIKKLVIKPKIGAWGLNWQHCNHMVYMPTHSYEQYYQAIRRSWRFGQKRDVFVDLVYTQGNKGVIENLNRKNIQAEEMFANLVREMNNSIKIEKDKKFNKNMEVAKWLM